MTDIQVEQSSGILGWETLWKPAHTLPTESKTHISTNSFSGLMADFQSFLHAKIIWKVYKKFQCLDKTLRKSDLTGLGPIPDISIFWRLPQWS